MCVNEPICKGFLGKLVVVELGFNYYKGRVQKVEGGCLFLRLMTDEEVIVSIPDIKTIREVRG